MPRSSSLTALCLAAATLGAAAHAQQAGAPRPLPARAVFSVQLPGPVGTRYVNVAVSQGVAAWSIDGCLGATARAGCRASVRVVLTQLQRVAYVQLWQQVYATPRCEPEAIFPGDRMFTVDSPDGAVSGRLPADPAQIPARNAGPCRAYARLAYWVAQTFNSAQP